MGHEYEMTKRTWKKCPEDENFAYHKKLTENLEKDDEKLEKYRQMIHEKLKD